jgi:hypothetical protein
MTSLLPSLGAVMGLVLTSLEAVLAPGFFVFSFFPNFLFSFLLLERKLS